VAEMVELLFPFFAKEGPMERRGGLKPAIIPR